MLVLKCQGTLIDNCLKCMLRLLNSMRHWFWNQLLSGRTEPAGKGRGSNGGASNNSGPPFWHWHINVGKRVPRIHPRAIRLDFPPPKKKQPPFLCKLRTPYVGMKWKKYVSQKKVEKIILKMCYQLHFLTVERAF